MMTVRVSKRNNVAVPAAIRKQLNIHSGDRLLADIQDGMLILIPAPVNFTEVLAGLHREIWEGVDPQAYIAEEREAWKSSRKE